VSLLRRVAAVNDRVVVVLANGSAVLTSPWQEDAGAILECWLSGQAAGGAVADLLLGVAAPSGRLAESIPVRLEDTSSFLNFPGDPGHVRYGEGVFVGYRGHDRLDQPVSFPFGHGLTYTTFEHAGPDVEVTGSHAGGDLAVRVSVAVTNTGPRPGREVVQVYVHDVDASVARPPRELKGLATLTLEPGETATAVVTLTSRDFSFWSERVHDWVLEPGEFELLVGRSSRDLPGRVPVRLDAPRVAPPLGPLSSLDEWLADPTGAALLGEVLGTREDGRIAGMLGDVEVRRVVGNFPLRALAGFGTFGIDHAGLDALVARLGP